MRVACLFSGGKDSNFALFEASKKHEIKCLITMISKNPDSYMFQTPGIDFTKFQAKALEIPIIEFKTFGEKEKELVELEKAISKAIKEYKIQGIVSGAIKSTYQSSRIQEICNKLDIYSINPIWQINEKDYLKLLLKNKFKIKIIAIASYPFTKEYIGKIINEEFSEKLIKIQNKFKISIIGEGGEYESFILDSPMFKKSIEIKEFKILMDGENCGKMIIKKIKLVDKN